MKLKDAKIREPSRTIQRPVTNNRPSVYTEDVTQEYYFIEIEGLRPFSNQARRYFNKDRLDELASTIKEHGIRQPLTVIPVADEPGKYEIVSGERRWKAARLAGLSKVPCLILKKDQKANEIAIIENIQREDLHPIELGNAYKQLLDNGICSSQEHIADRLGVSRTKVNECIAYTHFPQEIQYMILEREIFDRSFLRKVKSRQSADEMRSFINSFINGSNLQNRRPDRSSSNLIVSRDPRVMSVLRVYLSDTNMRVNKRGIARLSNKDKVVLRDELKEILHDLENAIEI